MGVLKTDAARPGFSLSGEKVETLSENFVFQKRFVPGGRERLAYMQREMGMLKTP